MYDFWYTLGVAAIDHPNFLNNITAAGPKFTFVERQVIEAIDGKLYVRRGPSTGLLERDATTNVRLAISKQVKGFSPSAPPIGIYTAGRFSQLMNIPFFQEGIGGTAFADIIRYANLAYVQALGAGPASPLPTFPAILGMCLMDGQVAEIIDKEPALTAAQQAQLAEIRGEFGGLSGDRSWEIVKAFVSNNPDFVNAAFLLMAGDNNPWSESGTTLEQMIFWPADASKRGEHAIP